MHMQTPLRSSVISPRRFCPSISLSKKLKISYLGILGSDGTASGSQISGSQPPYVTTLSTKDKDDLRVLYDGLQGIMKELDDLLKKYRNLESSHNPIDRLKWGQEDLVKLREKIRSNITFLTAFNGTLAKYVHLITPF